MLDMAAIYNQYIDEVVEGAFYPSLEDFDPGITAKEYEKVLCDESLVKKPWLDVLVYLYRMGGIGSCKQIANQYGKGAPHYNSNAINIAKATDCPLDTRVSGEKRYWPVLFFGKELPEVKEFDQIICNKDYREDENYQYLDQKEFNHLIAFIHAFSKDAENADALEFMKIGYKRNLGEVVSIKNYVGIIQMKNGFQIQVLPKISFGEEDDKKDKETKKVFLKMLRFMKDFPSKVFQDASLKVDRMNLYELFINMYLQEVRQLVKRGIKSAYVSQEDNLKYYKGKLLTGQQIRINIGHNERFYVSYDEFHRNRPENRLIKATLQKLQKITASAENAKEIRQLLTACSLILSLIG